VLQRPVTVNTASSTPMMKFIHSKNKDLATIYQFLKIFRSTSAVVSKFL